MVSEAFASLRAAFVRNWLCEEAARNRSDCARHIAAAVLVKR
jgi:hypothetical protein